MDIDNQGEDQWDESCEKDVNDITQRRTNRSVSRIQSKHEAL